MSIALLPGSEWCQCCGRRSGVGFSVPDEVWLSAVPGRCTKEHDSGETCNGAETCGVKFWRQEYGLLCVVCFAMFADERLIEWDADIQFWPVSLRTSIAGAGYAIVSTEDRR